MAATTAVPASWVGRTVGELSPAGTVAQYRVWTSSDRARANTVAADLIRLAQNGDQLAPVMLVAIMGPYLRKRCRMYPLDDVISEFVEEIYRFNPGRQKAQANNFASRVMQRLRRQRERIERIEAEAASMPQAVDDADEFVKVLGESQLSDDNKRLLFRIRVLDERVDAIAAERHIASSTMYRDLARVERQLIDGFRHAA